jgi:hypothetical protein
VVIAVVAENANVISAKKSSTTKFNFISFFKLLNAIVNEQLSIFVPKNGFAEVCYGRKHTEAIEADESPTNNKSDLSESKRLRLRR